ncbi:YveK family protein [Halalkalibacter akibai]|uniref:Lipopolysaccharide biosynthesis n=1 Tax=Halalkalibacter akibai (strain ATCC 43226 / DSM 21942 / CIP 109018 / JCM 9157 / 1139) TaxID=1236973 RepID=W4QWA7_HALA3|nr:Wzz/FepE/Etk N-terminal domain-containing protein [Halalkalibacter akibai]GAE35913.1 lipopolysaccharide biosynthesis [Halalkalibacter akibai JCM 9157]
MEQGRGKEIEIKKIFDLIKRRLWIVVLFTIVTTGLGAVHSQMNKPVPIYEATARIMISDDSKFFETLIVVIKEPPIMEAVIKELGIERSAQGLSNQIFVNRVGNSNIVTITVNDRSQEQAAVIANTVAEVYKREVANLFDFNGVDMFAEAQVIENPWPINPASNRMIKLGLVAGIVLGIGFIFLLDSLDNRLRSARQIEKILELPVLGTVSKMNKRTVELNKGKKANTALRGETIGS